MRLMAISFNSFIWMKYQYKTQGEWSYRNWERILRVG